MAQGRGPRLSWLMRYVPSCLACSLTFGGVSIPFPTGCYRPPRLSRCRICLFRFDSSAFWAGGDPLIPDSTPQETFVVRASAVWPHVHRVAAARRSSLPQTLCQGGLHQLWLSPPNSILAVTVFKADVATLGAVRKPSRACATLSFRFLHPTNLRGLGCKKVRN